MINSISIRNGLEDLLAELHYARRNQELGRLALLAYCEVRSWARQADEMDIANHSTQIFTQNPSVSKDEFLAKVDELVDSLERLLMTYPESRPMESYFSAGHASPHGPAHSLQ